MLTAHFKPAHLRPTQGVCEVHLHQTFKPCVIRAISSQTYVNPLPPNVPDLEHQICQWTTNGSQEDAKDV